VIIEATPFLARGALVSQALARLLRGERLIARVPRGR
jgi:hypothetical protein